MYLCIMINDVKNRRYYWRIQIRNRTLTQSDYGLCTVWILMQSNIKTILIRNYKSIWRSLPVFYYLASVGQRYITLPLVYEEYHYLLFILIKVSSILFYPGGLFNVILYIRYDVSWKYKRIESSFSYDICCVVTSICTLIWFGMRKYSLFRNP